MKVKLMRRRKKWGRCKIHGQGCEVAHEIRNPLERADDKRDYERDLLLAELEMKED